jgi:hypothetical protein
VAVSELGADGVKAVQDWVAGGGHFVGWREGARLATLLGVSTATLADPTSDVPGTLFRVRVDPNSALRRGVGRQAYAFYEYDYVMRASSPAYAAVSYPPVDSPDWFVSGFASGAQELGSTAAVSDEPFGAGRTTISSVDPNYRAFTTGFQKILRNTLVGHDLARSARAAKAGSLARARRSGESVRAGSDTVRLAVRPHSRGPAALVLGRFGAHWRVQRSPGRVAFLISNPRGVTLEQHPFARELPRALERAGVETIAYKAP